MDVNEEKLKELVDLNIASVQKSLSNDTDDLINALKRLGNTFLDDNYCIFSQKFIDLQKNIDNNDIYAVLLQEKVKEMYKIVREMVRQL